MKRAKFGPPIELKSTDRIQFRKLIEDRQTNILNTLHRELDECPKCKGHGGWNLTLNAYGPEVPSGYCTGL